MRVIQASELAGMLQAYNSPTATVLVEGTCECTSEECEERVHYRAKVVDVKLRGGVVVLEVREV